MASPMYRYLGPTRLLAALHATSTCCHVTSLDPRVFGSRQVMVMSSSSSGPNNNDMPSGEVTRQDLRDEAAALTRALYRRCFRSIKVIRWGNSFDDMEFQKREDDFLKSSGGIGIMSMSMAAPPDKEDELRSRVEYYQSYARECFVQESDCLDNDPLRENNIKRYLHYLRKGDKDRKWLLADMMFPDPYKTATDYPPIERFEAMANKYLRQGEDSDEDSDSDEGEDSDEDESVEHETEDDDFFEPDEGNPEWLKNPNK